MRTLCFTLFLLLSASLGQRVTRNMIDYLYEVSRDPLIIQDARNNLIDFTEGFLEGIGATNVFKEIKGCLVDSQTFMQDVAIGIQDLQTKDPETVYEGIKLLGQASQIIPDAVKLCKAADSDIKNIIKLIRTFQSPTSFIYHAGKSLLIDRVEVFNEVLQTILAFEKKDYKEVGYWIGRAMDTIFIETTKRAQQAEAMMTKDSYADILAFVEGFLQGAGSASTFDNIKACLHDSGTVILDLDNGIKDIETRNPAEVKEGIQLLGQAAQIVPDAVKLCKASEVDIETLVKMIESFQNPISFLYEVGKSLLINHVEVIQEVTNAEAAYKSQNYNQLGYWVGKAMDTIFVEQPLWERGFLTPYN